MKFQLRLSLLLALLYCSNLTIYAQGTPDYRKVRWGITSNELYKLEPGSYKIDNTTIEVGEISVNGQLARLGYKLENDKVIAAIVFFTSTYSNHNQYVHDYNNTEKALTKKYGKPSSTKTIILKKDSGPLQPDPGFDIFMGNRRLVTKWEGTRTTIRHGLRAPNNHFFHYIQYISTAHMEELEKHKEDNL